jgi:hypothetical protein
MRKLALLSTVFAAVRRFALAREMGKEVARMS